METSRWDRRTVGVVSMRYGLVISKLCHTGLRFGQAHLESPMPEKLKHTQTSPNINPYKEKTKCKPQQKPLKQ
jgi:hypothetical protein